MSGERMGDTQRPRNQLCQCVCSILLSNLPCILRLHSQGLSFLHSSLSLSLYLSPMTPPPSSTSYHALPPNTHTHTLELCVSFSSMFLRALSLSHFCACLLPQILHMNFTRMFFLIISPTSPPTALEKKKKKKLLGSVITTSMIKVHEKNIFIR